jgi:DNA-binding transcriptional regulator YhcF (GntR family)
MFGSVFDLQEKAIEDILSSYQAQRALEAAPRSIDPIQQTVVTILQGYLNHPDVKRQEAIESIRFLNQPMLKVQIDTLRRAYKEFQKKGDIRALLTAIEGLRERFAAEEVITRDTASNPKPELNRDNLRLICFDFLS